MTQPVLGGGNAYYITSPCATNMEFGEIKLISKLRKFNYFGMNKFNTIRKN